MQHAPRLFWGNIGVCHRTKQALLVQCCSASKEVVQVDFYIQASVHSELCSSVCPCAFDLSAAYVCDWPNTLEAVAVLLSVKACCQ